MFLTQTQNQGLFSDKFIFVLYAGLIIYFAYKIFKSRSAAKSAQGQVEKFKKNMSKMMIFLMFLIAGVAIFSIFSKQVLSGSIMLLLLVAMALELSNPNVIAENGLVLDSKWVDWKDVKKWSFDEQSGELIVRYKKDFNEKTGYLKFKKEDIENAKKAFKRFKLNK